MIKEITRDRVQKTRCVKTGAFSLIELLVACAVLALLTVLIAQIVGLTSNAVNTGSKRLVGMAQARFALDRLGADLLARVGRVDIDRKYEKLDGNDRLSFFSEVESVGGDRRVSAVCYRVQETAVTRKFQLERGVRGTSYNGGLSLGFLPSTFPSFADADFDVLADGVLRLEFCYLKSDGTLSSTASQDMSNISALVVSVAVLDSKTRKMAKDEDLGEIAAGLPDAQEGKTPMEVWQETIKQPSFAAQVPDQVRQAIRFYERYYYLN